MGRPNRCCKGCELPVVECYVENLVFYWSVQNAESAKIFIDNSINFEEIILDTNGNASGSIDFSYTQNSYYYYSVTASSICGTVTCTKDCFDAYCYWIRKLTGYDDNCDTTSCVPGDGLNWVQNGCVGSNCISCRKDHVTIEWFFARFNATNYNGTIVRINNQRVDGSPTTRNVGSIEMYGLYGQLSINRCNLEDVYQITVDGVGECGLPLSCGTLGCCANWVPDCIDKKNTAVAEISIGDGYSWSTYNQYINSYFPEFNDGQVDYIYSEDFSVQGLGSLAGTFLFPLACGSSQQVVLISNSYVLGQVMITKTVRESWPLGNRRYGFSMPDVTETTVITGDLIFPGCIGIRFNPTSYRKYGFNGVANFDRTCTCILNQGTVINCGGFRGSQIDSCLNCTNDPQAQSNPCNEGPSMLQIFGCENDSCQNITTSCLNIFNCGIETNRILKYLKPNSSCIFNGPEIICSNDSGYQTLGSVKAYYDCL